MTDNPIEIADFLVAKYGLDEAVNIALEGIQEANEHTAYYELSVWREVVRKLRAKVVDTVN